MTASALENKRRLERHSRRDGKGARPALMQRNNVEEEDRSSVGYIRSFVESANHAGSDLSKRFNIFSMDDGTSGTGSASTTANDNSGSSNTRNSGATPSTSDTRARTTASVFSFTFQTSTHTTSSRTSIIEEDTSTSSISTPTSTRTTHTSITPTSTSSAILTTTEAASSSSLAPSTSIAFVTSVPTTASANNAASSSTSTAKSDSGVGVGPIIGIVAGSLAGIAVIVVIVGFLIKKFGNKEDPYESNPFDRDEFRRHSAMLPDGFDSEEFEPPMSEYNNNGGMYGGGSGGSDAGYAGAGAAIVGGYAAGQTFTSHNDSGRPRPPTMFQKHINGPAAQYSNNEAGPQLGAYFNPEDNLSPQLPPMAFGGSDPYSIAGVGRNHEMLDGNISNPYAHLDRSPTNAISRNASQAKQYSPQDEYANLNRNGSHGSSNEQYQSGNEYDYDTAGRPGTSEGRSGTPDLPNVQQTYAVAGVNNGNGQETERVVSPHHMVASPEHINYDMYNQAAAQYQAAPQHHQHQQQQQQQPLQVRNLLSNPHGGYQQDQADRPVSRDSNADNDDAAYGGVW